ncbi:response regulator transcription factor [Bosea rubneri]|uniref:Response regulator transcription factor n=1 Tax=Bosea rubneri TaxID=3075434 RepID=A0ABU3SAG4_9HYPH|nr:response regulator transcription factor [Bosea sp. ZW T0_25]MDU0341780.1 response regulator transcription factor [Bosea sp. ZW T0_25]
MTDTAAASAAPLGSPEAHILVVDDDPQIRFLVSRLLRANGYRVSAAANGREMNDFLQGAPVDLIVLDVMLPGSSGFDLCSELRRSSAVPVIMLTARGEENDRIAGLDLGADDYLAKPFSPGELVARINALIRRARRAVSQAGATPVRTYAFSGWALDIVRRELVDPHGTIVDLSTGEFDMLRAFVEAPGKVLTREALLDIAKNRVATGFDRVVDVQISRLRKKIEADAGGDAMIKTVRGTGYMFLPQVERR